MKITCPYIWSCHSRALWLAGTFAWSVLQAQSHAAVPVVAPLGAYRGNLQAPSALAVDAAGNLYVTEPRDGRIVVFDGFGRVANVMSGFSNPLAIAVDSSGHFYVAEGGTGSVSVFDGQWNLLSKLGAGNGEFVQPNFIALEPVAGGLVYVTDGSANEVKAYQDGTLAFRFTGEGTNALSFPTGMCMSPAGELFVVDQNNDRLQVFDRNGVYLRQFSLLVKLGMFGSAGGRSQGITVDSQGRVLVADSYQGVIKVYDSLGLYLGRFASFGEGSGQLRTPMGLALDPYNRLFVGSVNNSRVEVFGLDAYFHFKATPAGNPLAEGTTVTFSVITGGPGPFTWQWTKDGLNLSDGGNVSGSASAAITLAGATTGDSGVYAVLVNGTVASPTAILTVLRSPVITQPVSDLALVAGSDAIFSVVADGSPVLSYQWQKDGRDLEGETAATLIVAQVQDPNAGVYSVAVSNAVGVAKSSGSLTVLHPPSITTAPLNLVVATGSDAAFSVEATGSAPLTFQWQKDGVNLPGATSPTLVLPSVQDSSAGTYGIVVANTAGTATATATLTVMMPPVISQPPINLAVVIGSNASFYVVADGSPRLRYQWQKDGLDLVAQNGTALNLYQVQDADGGSYSVTVFNDVGTATAAALLTITHPPIVNDFQATTTRNDALLIPAAELLAAASSPDQSPLTVSSVTSPTAQGGTAVLLSDTVTYTPRRGFAGNDDFGYTVTDANGNSASARILVTVTLRSPRIRTLVLVEGGVKLIFEGTPGQTYALERMDLRNPSLWTRLAETTAGTDSLGTFVDATNVNGAASYRIVSP